MMYMGMVGAFLFIVVQLVLLVDFAHSWADRWVGNYQETNSRGWYAGNIIAHVYIIYSIPIKVLLSF